MLIPPEMGCDSANAPYARCDELQVERVLNAVDFFKAR